jgi:hypothetical protein
MKKIFLPFTFFLCLSKYAVAQDNLPEFGQPDMAELTMKECAFEKNANAMNLVRTATIWFDKSYWTGLFSVHTENRVRIKIFNARGFAAANVKIPYSNKKNSSIAEVEAYIYYLDARGKIVRAKLGKKDIFDERSKDKNASNFIAFTFPDLTDGAVIEYRYSRVDKNSLQILPWFFQDQIPTAYSKVTADVPGFADVRYHVLAVDPVEKDSSFQRASNYADKEESRSFTMRNIRSFRTEPLMTPLKSNLQRLEFFSRPAAAFAIRLPDNQAVWPFVNTFLLEARFFGKQLNQPVAGTEKFLDSVKNLPATGERIAAVFNFVGQHMSWNGEQTFYGDSVAARWAEKAGSSADINILFLNFLRRAGVRCYPALVSTHENGIPDLNFPYISQFNGVDVVAVDSPHVYLIDCIQRDLSCKMPPFNAMNRPCYVVDPERAGWIRFDERGFNSQTEVQVAGSIDSSGLIKGMVRGRAIGFAKIEMLARIKEAQEGRGKKETILVGSTPDLIIDSLVSRPPTGAGDTLELGAGFHIEPVSSGKNLFFSPSLFFPMRKNPFVDSARYSDIDFGCSKSIRVQINLETPDIFSVDLPRDTLVQMKDSGISFQRKTVASRGRIEVSYIFLLKNALYSREEYRDIKSFFDKFYVLMNEEIYLTKKTGRGR